MPDFRRVTDTFTTSPQITVADVAEAARQGFTLIINNRPDGEAADQTPAAVIEAAAKAAGLDYVHIPIVGGPSPAQVAQVEASLKGAKGPVLAYCRSGTRSINAWAMANAREGDRATMLAQGAAAGYDLSGALRR